MQIKGSFFSKRFIQTSTLSHFSSLSSSKFLAANQSQGFKLKFSTPANQMQDRNLEEKMDEKSDNEDIWKSLFENKLLLMSVTN